MYSSSDTIDGQRHSNCGSPNTYTYTHPTYIKIRHEGPHDKKRQAQLFRRCYLWLMNGISDLWRYALLTLDDPYQRVFINL